MKFKHPLHLLLLIGTFICGLLLGIRVICYQYTLSSGAATTVLQTKTFNYFYFLLWNLWLAWIPYVLANGLKNLIHQPRVHGVWLFLVGLFWLLFYPNAPYILTDFIHLRSRPPVPIWYDMLVFFAFASVALLLGVLSIILLENSFKTKWPRWSVYFPYSVLVLGSFGVYLGRFLRWNSWDVFVRPWVLVEELLNLCLSAKFYTEVLLVILPLSLIQLFFYWLIKSLIHPKTTLS